MATAGSYDCNQSSYQSDTFGLYYFQDINNGECVLYDSLLLPGAAPSAAKFFDTMSRLCGGILALWLLMTTCCPILLSHKKFLLALAILACMFQGLFFVFYANSLCKAHGCAVSRDGGFAIGGAFMFLVTILAVWAIKPIEPGLVARGEVQEQDQFHEQEQIPQPEVKIHQGDEGLRPSVTGIVT